VCGMIQGLLTARNYITDLNKSMESSDEWPTERSRAT
jgi:hypothetical protein